MLRIPNIVSNYWDCCILQQFPWPGRRRECPACNTYKVVCKNYTVELKPCKNYTPAVKRPLCRFWVISSDKNCHFRPSSRIYSRWGFGIRVADKVNMNAKHNERCKMSFGRPTKAIGECPRCDEIRNGAEPRQGWNAAKVRFEKRSAEFVRRHDCKASGCTSVCTFGDW